METPPRGYKRQHESRVLHAENGAEADGQRRALASERFRQSGRAWGPAAATLLLPFRTSGVRRARSASDGFRSPCQQQSVGRRTARSRLVQLAPLSSIVGISASTPPPIAGARAVGGRQADPSRRGADRGRARGRACRERAVPGTEPALGRRPIIIGCRSSSPARSGPRTGSRWPSRTCSTRPGSSRRTARSCSPSAEHVPERTAESVARLEAAGYATVGKTNLHEFAYGISSQNPAFRDRAEPGRAGRLASSSGKSRWRVRDGESGRFRGGPAGL
jgi:hypothetical protein